MKWYFNCSNPEEIEEAQPWDGLMVYKATSILTEALENWLLFPGHMRSMDEWV